MSRKLFAVALALALALACLAFSRPALAADDAGVTTPATTPAQAPRPYGAVATRTSAKIRVDGKLDDEAWKAAPILTDWHETRINIGKYASQQTEVRVLYDDNNLYFGFHCLDDKPGEITAYTVQNEGFLHGEDNVTIILDTFDDHRNAYYFWTNALGVRTDGRIVDDGEAFSTDWQGEWESAGSIVSDGWIAEVRIPFSNFQFEGDGDHRFGMLLDREEARLQEWSNWTHDGVNSAKVSRYPPLEGLNGIRGRRTLDVTGYLGSSVQLGPGHLPDYMPNGGAELRYSPVPWGSLKLTLNPDFAQAEVDQDVLWLNPEERQLPERRPFFLEGGDLFVSPIPVFYSRRIAPRRDDRVLAGAQVVGKSDGLAFSIFDTQTLEHRPTAGQEQVNAGVLRLQKDIGKRSSVSVLALNRSGDAHVGLVGADTNLHIIEELFVQAQAVRSFAPDAKSRAEAFHVGLHRFDTTTEFWVQYEDIGANFRDPLGYVPVLDKQSVTSHIFYNWFTQSSVIPRIDTTYDDVWRFNHANVETRHYRDLNIQPFLNDKLAFSLDVKLDSQEGYANRIFSYGLVVLPNDWQSVSFSGIRGEYLGGEFAGFNAQASWKFGAHLAAKMSGFYTKSWNLPLGSSLVGTARSGDQWLYYGQLRYQFTPDLYTRLTVQYGDVNGIADLNGITGTVIDAVFGWHYRMGSDFFLLYTDQPLGGSQQHLLLAKASYTF